MTGRVPPIDGGHRDPEFTDTVLDFMSYLRGVVASFG
jgi:hypothetical protein